MTASQQFDSRTTRTPVTDNGAGEYLPTSIVKMEVNKTTVGKENGRFVFYTLYSCILNRES